MLTLWQLRRQSYMQPGCDNCTTLLLHRVLLKRQSPIQVDTKHCHMLSQRQIDASDGHTRRMIGIVCDVSTFRRSEPPISGFICVQVVLQSDVGSTYTQQTLTAHRLCFQNARMAAGCCHSLLKISQQYGILCRTTCVILLLAEIHLGNM